ncbi:MAG: YIP1 family protein [Lachnospiraceae bacterium]|nr:YIP1 family protein [Lachnospiraceae bacterium]
MRRREKTSSKAAESGRGAAFPAALRYALYVIVHPLDGFWDLKHEKRGSLPAALTIAALMVLSSLWRKQFTSFLFLRVDWTQINIWLEMAEVVLPLVIFCVSNWSVTTLFDGKGTMKDVFTAVGYSLTPYVLINVPLCLVSNLITSEEGGLYTFFYGLSLLWCAVLVVCAMIQTHEYTLGHTVISLLVTLVFSVIVIVLILVIICLTTDAFSYFWSVGREIVLRTY